MLEVVTTANQDPLLSELYWQASSSHAAHAPIIGIDIWEHAFYIDYKNVKADVSTPPVESLLTPPQYLKNIWAVINWEEAAKRYDAAV